jgi:hypothetical protein
LIGAPADATADALDVPWLDAVGVLAGLPELDELDEHAAMTIAAASAPTPRSAALHLGLPGVSIIAAIPLPAP